MIENRDRRYDETIDVATVWCHWAHAVCPLFWCGQFDLSSLFGPLFGSTILDGYSGLLFDCGNPAFTGCGGHCLHWDRRCREFDEACFEAPCLVFLNSLILINRAFLCHSKDWSNLLFDRHGAHFWLLFLGQGPLCPGLFWSLLLVGH